MNAIQAGLLGAALALAGSAQAARPLQTDDAEPVAAGQCELEGEHARVRQAGGRSSGEALDLSCGWGQDTQAGVGYGRSRADEGHAQSVGAGFKTLLWQAAGETPLQASLAGAFGWARVGDAGWQHESSELRLVLTLPVAGAFWHLNLGHLRDHATGRRATPWGLAWELQAIEAGRVAWAPMAEFTGDDRGEHWFNAGLRITALPDRLWLDVAWQRQTAGGDARGVAAGFKLAF